MASLFVGIVGIGLAHEAHADSIVIDRHTVVDTTLLISRFTKSQSGPITFELSYALGGINWKYQCPGMEWNWDLVQSASEAFAEHLNNSESLNIDAFLSDQGFTDCARHRGG